MIALAVLVALLGFGFLMGTRQIELEAKSAPPCDCQRCWYVGDPPEGTPMCKRFKTAALVGAGALVFLALRALLNKSKKESVHAGAWADSFFSSVNQ